MRAVLSNLFDATFASAALPALLIRYAIALALVFAVAWPVSDVVGRDAAPATFAALALLQVIAVPFIISSIVSGRIELPGRISIDDWVSYTPVSPLAVACAHALWGLTLAALVLLIPLPLIAACVPLAGDGLRATASVLGAALAFGSMASAVAYLITLVIQAEWVTSAASDAAFGMWVLFSMSGIQEYQPARVLTLAGVPDMLSPMKGAKAALIAPSGPPWHILAPLALAALLTAVAGVAGALVRRQARGVEHAGRVA